MPLPGKPVLSLTEAICAILADHPEGLTLREIQRHPLWDHSSAITRQRLFANSPSQATIQRVLMRYDQPIASSSNRIFPEDGFWTPTAEAIKIGQETQTLLSTED